jgi:asparagine synthase (glutamine-hydrolysing)
MCGIFFYLSGKPLKGRDMKFLEQQANKIKHRGPDETRIRYYGAHAMACFHRLQITDPTPEGMQPFSSPDWVGNEWVCMVNGEIYNFKQLAAELTEDPDFEYAPTSHSDCEVVLHKFLQLWKKYGLETPKTAVIELMKVLDGEYAVVLYNTATHMVAAFTDELRVRPLFTGFNTNTGSLFITSEQKAISHGLNVRALAPGTLYLGVLGSPLLPSTCPVPYWETPMNDTIKPTEAARQLREILIANIHAKMHPDRPYGFLLSGGLDSSLICGVAARYCKEKGLPRIRTFTVGFSPDAPDVVAAQLVADHIDSMHEPIIVPYQTGIDLIPEIIRYNESWDQTTTRASTPMGIAAREIKKRHPEIVVIYSGEVADELLRGYLYNRISRSPNDIRADMIMRLQDLTYFDGLRADRVIASQGMELRLPFFSKALLKFAFSLPVDFLDPSCHKTAESPAGCEKWLLRTAFDGLYYIPQEILWRTKNAFSDATSVMTDAGSQWKEMLKAEAAKYVTDSRFASRADIYPYQTPQTKEDMWYRDLFDSYEYEEKTIPYQWLPSWVEGVTDSSATTLDVFTL